MRGKHAERCGKVIGRSRADMAKLLRQDQVGIELAQRFGIHPVDAFAARSKFAHQAIYFRRSWPPRAGANGRRRAWSALPVGSHIRG